MTTKTISGYSRILPPRLLAIKTEPHPLMSTQHKMATQGGERDSLPRDSAETLSTVHLYYDDTELYTNTGHVIGEWDTELNGGKQTCLVLDRTVMHPQGGKTRIRMHYNESSELKKVVNDRYKLSNVKCLLSHQKWAREHLASYMYIHVS